MPGDAEPAVSLALTPPEEQLLALIREGRVDAEIAVRLGITNRDVKERIERLTAKLGARDRADLRDDPAETEPDPLPLAEPATSVSTAPRWSLAAAGLAGLLIGVGLTWMAMRGSGASSGLTADAEVFPSVTARVPETIPIPTATPRSTVIAGRTMFDAGQLFTVRGPSNANDIASADTRENLVVIKLDDVGVLRFRVGPISWIAEGSGPQDLFLTGGLNGKPVRLNFQTAGATRFLFGDPDSVGIYTTDGSKPQLVAWVAVPENPSIRFHAEVGVDGHLYVSPDAEDPHLPVAWDTGEALDVSGALQLSSGARLGDHWTFCDRDRLAACESLVRGLQLSPIAGELTCKPNSQRELADAELAGAQFSLSLVRTGRVPPCDFATRTLAAGDPLPFGGDIIVSAFAPDGSPLSIAVSRDGTLYIGNFAAKYACPCRSGQ